MSRGYPSGNSMCANESIKAMSFSFGLARLKQLSGVDISIVQHSSCRRYYNELPFNIHVLDVRVPVILRCTEKLEAGGKTAAASACASSPKSDVICHVNEE